MKPACKRSAATTSSRPPHPASRPVGIPGDTAFGIIQGYVEASNADPVTEITNLIMAQRAYEMNSKVIQAADQMSGTISNMRS
jgi:flagellar basal-body rod protein FlgG